MQTKYRMRKWELFTIVLNLSTYRIFTNYTRIFTEISGSGAVLTALGTGIAVFLLLWFLLNLYNKTQGKTLLDLAEKKFGKIAKWLAFAIIFLYLIFSASTSLREAGELIKAVSFPTAPLLFIFILLMIGAIFGCALGFDSIGRAHSLFIPFLALVSLFIIFFSFSKGEISNLTPALGYGVERTFLNGFSTIGLYGDLIVLFLLAPFRDKEIDYKKTALCASAVGIIINILTVFACTLTAPYTVSSSIIHPFYQLVKLFSLGRFFQRIDGYFMYICSIGFMLAISINIFFATYLSKQTFSLPKIRPLAYPIGIAITFIALIFKSRESLYEVSKSFYVWFIIIFILCAIILILPRIKLKRTLLLALSFFLILSQTGCYDNREIDKTAYVIAIGIDKGEKGYNYTFQISSPLAMGAGGEGVSMGEGEENTRVENIIIGANDLYEARNSLNNFLSKKINLSHLKMIIISTETAKESLLPHMTFLLQEREVRPHSKICVASPSAEEFLKGINPALEANTAEYYDLVLENGAIYSPPKTIREFVNENSIFASAIPLGVVSNFKESSEFSKTQSQSLRVSTSKSEFSGLCLFKNYRAVGFLTPEQSCLFGLLTNETKEADLTIPETTATIRVSPLSKADFRLFKNQNCATINMNMDFSVEIISNSQNLSKEMIEQYLERECYSLFLSAQSVNCDIFKAGNALRQKCQTISQWENLNWDKIFASAYFSPQITVFIPRSNFGTM